MNIVFANNLRVILHDTPNKIEKLINKEMSKHVVVDKNFTEGEILFEIKFKEKIKVNKTSKYISLLALFNDEDTYILDNMGNKFSYNPIYKEFLVEKRFNESYFFEILEYIFMNKILEKDLMFLHSSSFTYKNKTYVFPACNNTGKTKVLLEFLEWGAEFLGDDWVIIDKDCNAYPYFRNIRLYPNDVIEHKKMIKDWKIQPKFLHNYFDDSKEIKSLKILKKIYEKILLYKRILPYILNVDSYSKRIRYFDNRKIDLVVFYSRNNIDKIEHTFIDSETVAKKMVYAILNENTKKPDFENWFLFANENENDKRKYFETKYLEIMKEAFSKSKIIWLQIPKIAKPDEIAKYLIEVK